MNGPVDAASFDAVVPLRGRRRDVVVYAGGAQRFVFGQNEALRMWLAQMTPWIARVVQARAGINGQLADDLYQRAKLEIVLVDPSRLEPQDEPWLKLRIAAAVKRLWWRETRFARRVMGGAGQKE